MENYRLTKAMLKGKGIDIAQAIKDNDIDKIIKLTVAAQGIKRLQNHILGIKEGCK